MRMQVGPQSTGGYGYGAKNGEKLLTQKYSDQEKHGKLKHHQDSRESYFYHYGNYHIIHLHHLCIHTYSSFGDL